MTFEEYENLCKGDGSLYKLNKRSGEVEDFNQKRLRNTKHQKREIGGL